jgi:hypothetical protein
MDASTRWVIGEPVIQAFDIVALQHTVRERHMTVTATIFESDRCAVFPSVKYDWFATDRPAKQFLPTNFRIPGGDIPEVTRKHAALLILYVFIRYRVARILGLPLVKSTIQNLLAVFQPTLR